MAQVEVIHEKIDAPAKIIYYCKDCKRIVDGKSRKGKKKYSFACSLCGSKDVAYGTEKSILSFYHIKPAHLREWGLLEEEKEGE